MKSFIKFLNDESGNSAVEYIIIVACIVVAAIIVIKLFGNQIKGLFEKAE